MGSWPSSDPRPARLLAGSAMQRSLWVPTAGATPVAAWRASPCGSACRRRGEAARTKAVGTVSTVVSKRRACAAHRGGGSSAGISDVVRALVGSAAVTTSTAGSGARPQGAARAPVQRVHCAVGSRRLPTGSHRAIAAAARSHSARRHCSWKTEPARSHGAGDDRRVRCPRRPSDGAHQRREPGEGARNCTRLAAEMAGRSCAAAGSAARAVRPLRRGFLQRVPVRGWRS